jgi:lysozyme family protein
MTASNFDRSLVLVLVHEGGYVDHPKDPGGATNMGITFAVLQAWRGKKITKADVKKLTRKEAAAIYRKQYWDAVRGDELPAGVDYAVFDFAVNSGVSRAAKFLQAAVGVAADGHIGEITLEAVKDRSASGIIEDICDRRLAWLRKLKTFSTFGKGWTARVKGVRKVGLEMAKGGKNLVAVKKEVEAAKVEVIAAQEVAGPAPKAEGAVKPMATTGGKGLTTVAVGTAGSVATEAAGQLEPIADYVPIVRYLFAGLMVLGVLVTIYVTWKNLRGEADAEAEA